jgi:cell pole-organizing protein PopZ
MRQAGEPTVEEILESIKKVIARDNRAGAAEERRHREVEGVPLAQSAIGGPEADDADDVFDLIESAQLPDDHEEDDEELPVETPMVTEAARMSMRESLAALAMLAEPGMAPQIVRSGETSLESLTRELLRPALADWLDKNLPPMVERLVAAEIAKIVGKKG